MNQIQKANEEKKPVIALGDMNLDSKRWKKEDFDHKEVANIWRSGLSKAGMKIKDMGITWESHGRFNGEKRKSALHSIQNN